VSVTALLAELRRRDIALTADGDALRCRAHADALTPALREQLRERKGEILAFLRRAEVLARQRRSIVPLQPLGDRDPVFALGGHNGDVFCYRALARCLGADQPFFGLQPPGLEGRDEPLRRIEDLAAFFAAEIRGVRPEGPYVLAGYCAGGTIAFETARQLVAAGSAVRFVALFAGPHPAWYRALPQLGHRLGLQADRVRRHGRALVALGPAERRAYVADAMRRRDGEREAARAAAADPELRRRARLGEVTLAAVRAYTPRRFVGRLALFLPSAGWRDAWDPFLCRRWRGLAAEVVDLFGPDGCPGDRLLLEPAVAGLAESFRRYRDQERPHPYPASSRAHSSFQIVRGHS
jgi:thioesterase domain-containing protein